VCVYPQFVSTAWKSLINSKIKIATVANFPHGDQPIEIVIDTIKKAILDGAHEIDIVIPKNNIAEFISTCKKYCGTKLVLKIILETGSLTPEQIKDYSEIAIQNNTDFIKTSTGKISVGATLEAAEIILNVIKSSHKKTGLKISGGIRTLEQAKSYINLFEKILGEKISPARFRIGTSRLLQEILLCASQNPN
jgi:deoxyribose-phosphate aldolase